MKKAMFTLLLFFFCLQLSLKANFITPLLGDTIIQDYHFADKIKATKTEGLIRLKVTDFRKTNLANLPVWVHNKKGKYWHGTTDEKGEVFFLLPINTTYAVNVDQEENYRKFSIPKKAKYFKTEKVVLMISKVKEVERNDTIFQTIAAGAMPTASRVLIKIKIADLDGKPLEGEELFYESQNTQKIFYSNTDKNGRSQLLLPK